MSGFPDSSVDKESTCDAGDPGSIPGLGRSPGEGKGYPLQYSSLENSMGHEESDTTKLLSLSFKRRENWSTEGSSNFPRSHRQCEQQRHSLKPDSLMPGPMRLAPILILWSLLPSETVAADKERRDPNVREQASDTAPKRRTTVRTKAGQDLALFRV